MSAVVFKEIIPTEWIKTCQKKLDSQAEHCISEVDKLVSSLGISQVCAIDVVYLRTRHRHTQELEDELIFLHNAGTPPNMMEYGCTEETAKALFNAAENNIQQRNLFSRAA